MTTAKFQVMMSLAGADILVSSKYCKGTFEELRRRVVPGIGRNYAYIQLVKQDVYRVRRDKNVNNGDSEQEGKWTSCLVE